MDIAGQGDKAANTREAALDPAGQASSDRKVFTREDVVLYVFGAVVMAALIAFFGYLVLHLERELSAADIVQARDVWKPTATMDAQTRLVSVYMYSFSHRYEYAAHLLVVNSARTNAAFVVGALLALMGCFLVVRGVRESPVSFIAGEDAARARMNLAISSPGLLLSVLGVAIILVSLFRQDHLTLTDPGLTLPSPAPVMTPAPEPEQLPMDDLRKLLQQTDKG